MRSLSADKAKLIAAMCLFGTIGILRRYIPCSSGVLALARSVVGLLFLLAVRLFRRAPFPAAALRQNAPVLCASGVLLGGNWILLFEAYRYTTVAVATVSYYMAPVFILLLSPLVLHESLTLKKALCVAAALLGMTLVSGVWETGLTGMTGVVYGLGAATMYTGVVLLNKRIRGLSAGDRTIAQLFVAAVAMLPYVLLTEQNGALRMDAGALLLLIVAGVLHTGVAYTLYFGSIGSLPAQTAALFSYIDPVVAVLLSVLLLHEPLSALAAVGAALVICAAVVSELPPRVRPPA